MLTPFMLDSSFSFIYFMYYGLSWVNLIEFIVFYVFIFKSDFGVLYLLLFIFLDSFIVGIYF